MCHLHMQQYQIAQQQMQRTSCLHQEHKQIGQEKLIGLFAYTQRAHGQLRFWKKQWR